MESAATNHAIFERVHGLRHGLLLVPSAALLFEMDADAGGDEVYDLLDP